jgi:hypothetical protein
MFLHVLRSPWPVQTGCLVISTWDGSADSLSDRCRSLPTMARYYHINTTIFAGSYPFDLMFLSYECSGSITMSSMSDCYAEL